MEQEYLSTFQGGMESDSHPSLQPKNTYRNGLNGNLISHDGNNYSFEETEGTVLNWTMPLHTSTVAKQTKFVPIGLIRMGDKLIVHSTDNKTTGGDGEIGIVTFNNAGVGTYMALYYHADLRYTQAHMIFGYGLEENDNFHRQYWTDDFNQPRTMNVVSSIFTTNFASGTLVVGNSYMVITDTIGSITHAGNVYGPKQTLGNVFVATANNYIISGTVKVIALLSPNIFNYTPEKTMGTIEFVRYNFGGSIWCGVKLYAYRLSTIDGYVSSWTFTTNPISITSFNPSVVVPSVFSGYQNYQGQGANGILVNSTKTIDLLISDIPQEFDKIQVAVIEVDQAYETIRSTTIFFDDDITGTSMTVTHKGNEDLQTLLVDDLSLTSATIIRCKDMTTVKQRQIIGNLTSREEVAIDLTGATVTPLVYTMPTDSVLMFNSGATAGLSTLYPSFAHTMCASAGIPLAGILTGGHYVVRGTGSVTYNGTIYSVGETFVGVSGAGSFSVTSLVPIVKGCIRIKRYNKFGGGQDYQIIDLENEFFDYKSMASSMYLKGYFRDETYRLAVLAWDLFGNPFFVRFLKDEVMPSQSDASGLYGLLGQDTVNPLTQFYAQALGVTVSGIDITSLVGKISGISIVRVKRDKTILGQGIVLQNARGQTGSPAPYRIVPISSVIPQDDYNAQTQGSIEPYTWGTMGPEFDFDSLTVFPIRLQEGDRFVPVADLQPVGTTGAHLQGNQYFEMVGSEQEIYSKFYIHNPYTVDPTITQDDAIQKAFSLGMGTNYVYDTANSLAFYNKDIVTDTNHPPAPSAAAANGLYKKGAEGGERTVIITGVADYQNFSNGNIGPGTFNNPRKLLANYVRPKSILYGGTSDNAKANSIYQFCGHYLKIDATVLADINDGAGNYILNGMEVFGGDCFVGLYDRVSSVYDDVAYAAYVASGAVTTTGSFDWGLIFPVESEINVALREGVHMSKSGMHSQGGVQYKNTGTVGPLEDIKSYNFSYSTENDLVQYDALPVGFNALERFPYMIRYSELKVLGETIDNMRKYLINNFRNVDALHGEINNVMVGGGKLFYAQRRGIGYIPIEERETTPGELGQSVQLGVGGVAQRYDTIDKFYGCQHQSSMLVLEDRFIWWDMSRYSVISFGFGGSVEDTSVLKGMQTFFQNAFTSAQINPSTIYNVDQPLLGNGVVGVYDPIKKTAYLTFKFSSLNQMSATGREDFLLPQDFTIGIASQISKFIGFFSFTPLIYTEINSRVYAVNAVREALDINTVYDIGYEISKNGDTYVNIFGFATGNAIVAPQEPDFAGSLYWRKTSSDNEIVRMFTGEICKFFGIVYPHYIDIVVNPQISGQKSFDHAETYGNEIKYSDVICSTSNQSASDLNITATNKNYRYYDGKWNFSYPLYNKKARLTDEYMIVRLQMKNWITNIYTSLNVQKRIVYLKTIFRFRK